MPNRKNEWDFQDSVAKKESKVVLYDVLRCAKIPLSTHLRLPCRSYTSYVVVPQVILIYVLDIVMRFDV